MFNFAFSQCRSVFYHVVLGLMQGAVRQDRLNQSNSLLPLKGHSSEPALVLILPLSEQFHPLIQQKKETKSDFCLISELHFCTEENMSKTTRILSGSE